MLANGFGRLQYFSKAILTLVKEARIQSLVGTLAIAASVVIAAVGWWLDKRYGAAIRYSGIGRPYPIGNSVLAFLGIALFVLGLITAFILVMIFFF